MADRDVTVDIIARDKTGPGAAGAERNLTRVAKVAEQQRGALGRIADDWARGVKRIDGAARQWAGSGDTSAKRFVLGMSNGLGKLASLGGKIGSSLSAAVDSAGPHVKAALVGVLAAAALAAAPAIGAAVVGGAALGGVVGGVMIAARDARVKSAFDALKSDIGGALSEAAQEFVPATLDAIDTARVQFRSLVPELQRIFSATSHYVEPLTRAFGEAGKSMLSGIASAVERAGPIINVLGEGIRMVGAAVGDAFRMLSDNGEAMALGLKAVFFMVESAIRATALVLNGLIEAFEWLVKVMPGGKKLLASTKGDADSAAGGFKNLAGGFMEAATGADAAAAGLTKVQEAARAATEGNLSYTEAQIRAKEAVKQATATIGENGRATSLNTAAGRANQQALINMARAFNTQTTAADTAGVSADKASAAYRRNRSALINQAVAAGYTKREARALADQYLQTPKTVNTNVKVTGAQAALNAIQRLRAEAQRFQGTYTATMRTNYVTYGKPYSSPAGIGGSQYRGAAEGSSWSAADSGRARAGGPVQVNTEATVNVTLDGAPFYAMTSKAVHASERRQAWRAKVGRR